MTLITKTTKIWENVDRDIFLNTIKPRARPAILKGLISHWPAVAKGRDSAAALAAYIGGFYNGVPAPLFEGAPEINGRFARRKNHLPGDAMRNDLIEGDNQVAIFLPAMT